MSERGTAALEVDTRAPGGLKCVTDETDVAAVEIRDAEPLMPDVTDVLLEVEELARTADKSPLISSLL